MKQDTCRVCLERGEKYSDIFKENLNEQLNSIAKIEIDPKDGLPNKICVTCIKKLKFCIEFIILCEKSDAQLRCLLIDGQNEKIIEIEDHCFNNDDGIEGNTNEEANETLSNSNNILESYGTPTVSFPKKCNIDKTNGECVRQQCSICGKVVSSRFRLKTHLATHSEEKTFCCQYCDKKFTIEQNLKVHLRTHMGEKPHECLICGEKFAQSSGLTVHKRKHSGLLPYKCNLCPRNFRTSSHLQYHIKRHTGEKSYECKTCNRSFITSSDLKVHVTTHSGEKPHACAVCGLPFSRASNLKRHLQHSHRDLQEKSLLLTQRPVTRS